MEKKTICKLELNHETADAFKDAVANSYWFEFFVDDLPLWGFVGEYHPEKNDEDSKYVMSTHKQFVIKYNSDQVIYTSVCKLNKHLSSLCLFSCFYLMEKCYLVHQFDWLWVRNLPSDQDFGID
jgi:hypothetical protein